MRVAGRLAAEVLQVVAPHVKPGVSTAELDRICHDHIVNVQQAIPANVGYKGFPATVCTSVNNVICHGIPSRRQDPEGRRHRQYRRHRDQGRLARRHQPHVHRRQALGEGAAAGGRDPRGDVPGIRMVRPGATLGDIGHAIQRYAEAERFSVVREYCGHGIGRVYHEDPQVLHYGRAGDRPARWRRA